MPCEQTGAEVVFGLTRGEDVARVLVGCHRTYFGMSVSVPYLGATVTAAAVAAPPSKNGASATVNESRSDEEVVRAGTFRGRMALKAGLIGGRRATRSPSGPGRPS
jgi:hypothetical protein